MSCLVVDDNLFNHSGRKVFGTGLPLRCGRAQPQAHRVGNFWVVVGWRCG
jgi:hypothetical protein